MLDDGFQRTAFEAFYQALMEFRGNVVLTGGNQQIDGFKGLILQRFIALKVGEHSAFDLFERRRDIGHFNFVVAIDDLQVALLRLDELSKLKRAANQPT